MSVKLLNENLTNHVVGQVLKIIFCLICAYSASASAELQPIPTPVPTPTISPFPQAAFNESEFNFGTVLQGTPVVHSFTIINSGNAPLTIISVRPACGCTSATAANTQILPGAIGEVKVTFDTTGFDGAKEKTVSVTTNDPAQSNVVLTIKGYVEGTLVFNPNRLEFNDVIAGAGSELKPVKISIKNLSDLKITGFRASSQNLILQNGKMNDRFGSFDVGISPDAPTGRLVERVSVDTVRDNGEKNTFILPISALVGSTVLVQPRVVSFGVISPTESSVSNTDSTRFTRNIKIASTTPSETLFIKSVTASDPSITTELKTISAGQAYILTVRIDPKQVKKDLRGKVIVATSSKSNPSIDIDVFAILSGEE